MKTAFSLAATTFAALLACAEPAAAQLLGGAVGGAVNGALGGNLGAGPHSLDGDIAGSGALRGTGALDSDLPGRLRDRATATGRSVADRSTRAAGNAQQRAQALTGTAVERTTNTVQGAASTGAATVGNARTAANRFSADVAAQAEGAGSLNLGGPLPSPAVSELPSLPDARSGSGTPVIVQDSHETGTSSDLAPSIALSGRDMNVGADGRASGHAADRASADIAVSGSASAAR